MTDPLTDDLFLRAVAHYVRDGQETSVFQHIREADAERLERIARRIASPASVQDGALNPIQRLRSESADLRLAYDEGRTVDPRHLANRLDGLAESLLSALQRLAAENVALRENTTKIIFPDALRNAVRDLTVFIDALAVEHRPAFSETLADKWHAAVHALKSLARIDAVRDAIRDAARSRTGEARP
jgi:hypothetical protein